MKFQRNFRSPGFRYSGLRGFGGLVDDVTFKFGGLE